MAPGEERDDLAPCIPVLRPAVQQEDRVAIARFGDVHAQARRPYEVVTYPVEHVQRTSRAGWLRTHRLVGGS
jgi:hypothetical protein